MKALSCQIYQYQLYNYNCILYYLHHKRNMVIFYAMSASEEVLKTNETITVLPF